MSDEPQLRLFTAIELSNEWVEALESIQAGWQRVAGQEVKWVRPELMHLTLVFLGGQAPERVPAIQEGVSGAACSVSPFLLRLGEAGAFGPPTALNAVWVGLRDVPPALQLLHAALAERMGAAGVEFDLKPLVPHVTLGRGRRPMDRAASLRLFEAVQRNALSNIPPARIQECVLIESRLSRSGPTYQVLSRHQFGGTSGRTAGRPGTQP